MKAIKWIGHPVVLIILFLLLIIEGDNFGGFFLLYLILALPHGVPYALVAITGITSITVGFNVHNKRLEFYKIGLYIAGLLLMLISLIMFFAKGNKDATFKEPVPLFSFVFFGVCSFCFLLRTIYLMWRRGEKKLPQSSMRSA